jgi:hypothetical protein
MKIVICTQSYKGAESKRAFIKHDLCKIHKFVKEMEDLGWYDIDVFTVDQAMFEELKLTTERQ